MNDWVAYTVSSYQQTVPMTVINTFLEWIVFIREALSWAGACAVPWEQRTPRLNGGTRLFQVWRHIFWVSPISVWFIHILSLVAYLLKPFSYVIQCYLRFLVFLRTIEASCALLANLFLRSYHFYPYLPLLYAKFKTAIVAFHSWPRYHTTHSGLLTLHLDVPYFSSAIYHSRHVCSFLDW